MADLERDYLASKFERLERQQQVLAKYMMAIKHQLNELSDQFKNRLELEQLGELKDALTQLSQQFDNDKDSLSVPVELVDESIQENCSQQENQQKPLAIINRRRRRRLPSDLAYAQEEIQQQHTQARSSEYQLVFERVGSRTVLLEALEKAQARLIIVSPWLNRNSIDADLIQRFRDCLDRNCRIEIGWGHLSDCNRIGIGWRYNALRYLSQLEQDYPNQFRLKLLGTHEKFLVCDSAFAMLGSHNLLTSNTSSAEREVGICTTDPHIIQGLINRFDGAEVYPTQAMDESITASLVAFVNVEDSLNVQDIHKEQG
jgi:phosphatidylserine/phosphatidylglycerophosphate/cardiolipin synthase-like enzyme